MRRHVWRVALVSALGAVLMLTACAGVPTSGPVELVTPEVQHTQESGVRIDAEPPRPQASQERIVAGFMSAMASLEPGFEVARSYLTDSASARWQPGVGTTVIDAASQRVFSSGSSQVITATEVGHLDAEGRFSPVTSTLRLDLGLERVKGQWRISRPPTGLLITSTIFASYYSALDCYFVARSGTSVVPETLRVPTQQLSATAAMRALLRGPGATGDAVTTAIPDGASLTGVDVASDGTAQVNLQAARGLSDEGQAAQVVAQVAWTLRQVQGVSAARVTVNGQPLVTAATSADGVINLDAQVPLSPLPDTASTTLVGVVKGAVGRIDPMSGTFTPIGGALTRQKVQPRGAIAATGGGSVVYWISESRLYQGDVARVASLGALERPLGLQATSDGSVWVVTGQVGAQQLERIQPSGTVSKMKFAGLPAGGVVAFRVAPDQSRVAVVVTSDSGSSVVGVMGIVPGKTMRLGPWQDLSLAAIQSGRLTSVSDIAWVGPSRLALLAGATGDNHFGAYLVSQDGAVVTSVGPSDTVDPAQLVVRPSLDSPTLLVRTHDSRVEEVEDVWRWRVLAQDVSAVTWAW